MISNAKSCQDRTAVVDTTFLLAIVASQLLLLKPNGEGLKPLIAHCTFRLTKKAAGEVGFSPTSY